MGLFSNLKTDNLEEQTDSLGSFSLFETDIYVAKIKLAYADKSQRGAQNITFEFDIDGKEYRETLYVTNANGDNFYVRDGKKYPLPGFTLANNICIIASDKALADQDVQDKVISVYDYEAKGKVNKNFPVLMDLMGKEVALAIVKRNVFKKTRTDDGSYVDTDETRTENVIQTVFHPTAKLTVLEATKGTPATHWDKWLEKNQGKTLDLTKKKSSTTPAAATQAPKKSLFDN